MSRGQHRTVRLPGGITVTIVRLTCAASVPLVRAAAGAELYVLYGQTFTPPAPHGRRWPTGPGFYIGISASLRDQLRAGVSLRRWTTQRNQLQPQVAVLIRRPGRPLDFDLLRLIETHLIRTLSPQYTVLNTVTGCPTAAEILPRAEVLYGLEITRRLVDLLRGRLLHGVTGTPCGGSLHEQLVRLVLRTGPITTTGIVAAAKTAGINIDHHGDPTAAVRRDLWTRERDSRGPTRIHRTVVLSGSRWTSLYYSPDYSRADAIHTWTRRTGKPTHSPRHRAHRRAKRDTWKMRPPTRRLP